MDVVNTHKITTYCSLVDYTNEINGYRTYVFQVIEDDEIERLGTKYIMCTRYPNWSQCKFKLGDCGYLYCEEILKGITQWWDGHTFVKHRYDHIHFLKFVPSKDTKEDNDIIL
jgi:hypothetical protein